MLWLPLASLVAMGLGEVPEAGPATAGVFGQIDDQNLGAPVRVEDVEVVGRRGAARVAPETELDGAEIDALGAWDIGEVLRRMNETLGVGVDDEPVVIINGRRVANAAVFFDFPPDALVRAEVLPPEAAALYGGQPGKRVINLVLQRRFSSHDGRAAGSRPTQGGTSSLSADLRRSAIAGENTHQLGVRMSRDTALRAGERDRDLPGEGPGSEAITLRPRADMVSANASLTRALGDWSGVLSLNGQARDSRSVARFGAGLVESDRRSESLGGSVGLSGSVVGWTLQANLNGQASRTREDGLTDTRNENLYAGLNTSAGRTLMELPSGPVVANLSGALMGNRSTVERAQVRTTTRFQTREGRGALTVPLSKAGGGSVSGRLIGDLQATVGGSIRETSGGGGEEITGSLVWTPRRGVRLNGVWSSASDSVPDSLRVEPLSYGTPRVVFDFRTGQAVEIIPILGGNPDLRPPQSERLALAASLGPFTAWSLSGSLGYQRAASTDGIGVLPELTEDIEAAFPDRFQRDPDGRLVSIDYRPMNLRSSLTEGLNTRLNFNLPRPAGVAANEATVLRISLSHSLRLKSTIALVAGGAELDRLRGDGGGVSRQDARITLDARRGRWGANAAVRWQEGYRTRRAAGRDDPRDLVVAPSNSIDLQFSFQMTSSSVRPVRGDVAASRARRAGLQLNLEIDNLFDTRPAARLGDGSRAPGYGRDIQDPVGRTVRLTLQRRF